MGYYGWLAVYVAGALASPLIALFAVLFVISAVRSCRYRRRKGWLPETVPHSMTFEYYHSCAVDMDSQKLLCILAEKGIEFKDHEIDIGFFGRYQNLEDDMLRVNPNGTQPTFVHDGHPVVNVEEILEYIESYVPGPPMFPEDEQDRKKVIRWIHMCAHAPVAHLKDEHGNPAWTLGMATRVLSLPVMSEATLPTTFFGAVSAVWRHPHPLPEYGILWRSLVRYVSAEDVPHVKAYRLAFAVVSKSFEALEKDLEEDRQEFLVGKAFTLADACLVTEMARLEALGVLDVILGDSHPRIRDYWQRMKKRSSFKRAFQLPAVFPGLEELERCFARFRKNVADNGLVAAYRLEEDTGEEEEED